MRRPFSNPVFRKMQKSQDAIYDNAQTGDVVALSNQASYTGVIIKSIIALVLIIITATVVGVLGFPRSGENKEVIHVQSWVYSVLIISIIVGFISSIVGTLSVRAAGVATIIYAIAEGALLGTITVVVQELIPGVGLIAAASTMSIFLVMLGLYVSKIFRATSKFKKFMFAFMISILIMSALSFILRFAMPGILGGTNGIYIAIGVSVIYLIFATLMLINDFDYCQSIVSNQLPKKYEWQASLALLITVIWIYIEILRLLVLIVASISKNK